MPVGGYLRERWVSVALTGASMLICWFVLLAMEVPRDLVLLICGVLLAAEVVRLALGYAHHAPFWNGLAAYTRGGDDLLSVCDVVAEPHFAEGEVAWNALDAVAQAGRTSVAESTAAAAEYREFVEAWVHEVKTPVAAAKLACENNPGQQSAAVLRELDRVDGYVEQALYYARSGSVEHDYRIRAVRAGQLVRQAVRAQMRPLIDAGVHVQMGEGLDLEVFADDKWMVFALGQVIQNAVKYSAGEKNPELRFDARLLDRGGAAERVELAVRDTGCGICAADLPRVFEKGFVGENGRAAGQAKSTGLGLYLVRRLCDKMGLGVRVESEPGVGTCVFFSFPTNRNQLVDRA